MARFFISAVCKRGLLSKLLRNEERCASAGSSAVLARGGVWPAELCHGVSAQQSRGERARAPPLIFLISNRVFFARVAWIYSPSLSFALCARIEGLSYNITTLLNY